MQGYILDIILVIGVLFLVTFSARKGFISASKNIIALILTVVLLTSMQPVMMDFLEKTTIGDSIKQMVSENVTKTYEKEQLPEDVDTTDTEKSLMVCEALSLPPFMSNGIEASIKQMSEVKNNVMEVVTDSVSNLIMSLLSMLLLFVLVRLFVFLILKLLESLFALPGLKTVNRSLGAIIGIFNAALILYIVCGAVALFSPMESLQTIQQTIDTTYIVKHFYNNNLLLSLFI